MLYLFFAIFGSVSVGLLLKFGEQRGNDKLVMVAANYPIAVLTGSLVLLAQGGWHQPSLFTLALGMGGGLIWPATLFLMTHSYQTNGVAITSAFVRLSLVVPLTFALVFLQESIRLTLIGGLALAVVAVALLFPRNKPAATTDSRSVWVLPILILMLGFVDVWSNLFHTFGNAPEKGVFLILIFAMAAIVSWAVVLLQGRPIQRQAVLIGMVAGAPNYLITFCLLQALNQPLFAQRSAIVYSTFSVSTLVALVLAGVIIWRESVTKLQWAGAVCAVCAILLLNG